MVKGTRRKIEIKKRETKEQRYVAFSKRRQTLFSKAAELCCLSGANIAIFTTSPSDKSNVSYSFSGPSSASEIADCYLNGKLPPKTSIPQSKLRFWWTDPDLYRSCDDLSQLDIIENRMKRTKNDLMACLEKQENSRVCSLCSQIVSYDHLKPNPSVVEDYGESSSQVVSDYQNTSNPLEGSSQVATFNLKPCSSVKRIYGGESSSDQSRYLVNKDAGFINCLWETEKENNRIMSVSQETQPIINVNGGYEDQSFWDELYNEDVFGLNNGFCLDKNNNNPQPQTITTNDEADDMIDIGNFLNDEEIGI